MCPLRVVLLCPLRVLLLCPLRVLLLWTLLCPGTAQQTVLRLEGSEVTLEPKYTGNPSEINWKINGEMLVDMELNSPDEPLFYNLRRDRATINRTNGVLTIKDLRIEDSGYYRTEALVNNIYQYTDIILTVRACPDEPNITHQTTKENIVLYCESSTPGVTYEWFKQTGSVGNEQSYSEPRPEHNVTLTCVVDNEVCKKSSSIIIPYTPPGGPESWGHLLSSGAVFVLYTGLLIFIVNDLRKRKNEKSRSERRTKRRNQMEMEMETTDYDDCN
ncbi:uncharacterized protein LOC143981559 [Lithobates pipiens]